MSVNTKEQIKRVAQMNQPLKDNDILRGRLYRMKNVLQRELDQINECLERQYTGWFVLVKKDADGKWKSIGTISPEESPEEDCEWFENVDYDLIIPIPDPLTSSEFQGF